MYGEGAARLYTCQATELPNFTRLLKWWDARQYVRWQSIQFAFVIQRGQDLLCTLYPDQGARLHDLHYFLF